MGELDVDPGVHGRDNSPAIAYQTSTNVERVQDTDLDRHQIPFANSKVMGHKNLVKRSNEKWETSERQ